MTAKKTKSTATKKKAKRGSIDLGLDNGLELDADVPEQGDNADKPADTVAAKPKEPVKKSKRAGASKDKATWSLTESTNSRLRGYIFNHAKRTETISGVVEQAVTEWLDKWERKNGKIETVGADVRLPGGRPPKPY